MALALWLGTNLRSEHAVVGALVLLALLWGTAGNVAHLLSGRRRVSRTASDPAARAAGERAQEAGSDAAAPTVATILRLGREPDEIARAGVELARRLGPVHVVLNDREPPVGLDPEMTVHSGPSVAASIQAAARTIDAEAILLTSARGVPLPEGCTSAARLLDADTAWVIGRSRPFNRDRYASDRRELHGASLRRAACSAGLLTWETDATLVRTDVLAEHPMTDGATSGSWLRGLRRAGLSGTVVQDHLSLRAAPVASSSYWPDTVARQRALTADLSSALGSGPPLGRCIAALLLVRELFAFPLLIWLLMPALLTSGWPFDAPIVLVSGLLAATAAARWAAARWSLGLGLEPAEDIVSAIYHAPGSLLGAGAAFSRRIRSPRWSLPARPLVWAGLVGCVVAGYGLVGQPPGSSSSRIAAVASLLLLGLLWTFSIRALVERGWERTSYRVRLELEATLDGCTARLIDGSPSGAAVVVGEQAPARTGDEVVLEVELDTERTVTMHGVVASRRRRGKELLLGLELRPGDDAARLWCGSLLDAAVADRESGPTHVPTSAGRRPARLADRIVTALVVLTSVAVLATLALVLLGFRPMVIRSGSMVPTYGVGDVVFVDTVPARTIEPGDVVTLDEYAPIGESMTHRVRSIRSDGDQLVVETRGDANDTSETWTIGADEPIGLVRASVPGIGAPATLVRTSAVALAIAVVVVALVVAVVLGLHRRGARRPDPTDDDSSTTEPSPGDPAISQSRRAARGVSPER